MHLTSHPAPAAHAACGGASCRAVHRSSRKLCVVHSTDPQRDEGQQPSTSGAAPQIDLLNPAAAIVAGGRQPSTRRAAVGLTVATAVALGGNLGGLTSWLLGLDGGHTASSLRVDRIVPVLGFKRCYDAAYGYEFVYPADWLADQTLLFRAAQRAEAARALDPPPLRRAPKPREVTEPSAAFGPAGSTGEENISIIVAPIFEGFRLDSLGSPAAAAQQFLSTIAPQGSDRTATLISAEQRRDASGTLQYTFEFTIASPRFQRHNVATLATQDNLLYTLTAQCPQSRWKHDGGRLQQAAASLTLRPAQAQMYPGRLS